MHDSKKTESKQKPHKKNVERFFVRCCKLCSLALLGYLLVTTCYQDTKWKHIKRTIAQEIELGTVCMWETASEKYTQKRMMCAHDFVWKRSLTFVLLGTDEKKKQFKQKEIFFSFSAAPDNTHTHTRIQIESWNSDTHRELRRAICMKSTVCMCVALLLHGRLFCTVKFCNHHTAHKC